MKFKDFKNLKDLINYDFKNTIEDECKSKDLVSNREKIYRVIKRIKEEKNDITKFKEWKFKKYYIDNYNEIKIDHDCDSTELSLDIINEYLFKQGFSQEGKIRYFKTDYDYDKDIFMRELVIGNKQEVQRRYNEYYMGDTMNSFQTTASYALSLILKNRENYSLGGIHTIETIETLDKLTPTQLRNELRSDKAVEIFEELKRFIKLVHTMGNFIAVPTGTFNCARYRETYDYWDLTLESIRAYYLGQHTILCPLLHCVPKNKKWLDKFINQNSPKRVQGIMAWKSFIDKNLLNMYVDESDNYKVKKLFNKHSFSHKLPRTEDEFYDLLKNICDNIEERNLKIYNALEKNK